MEFAALVPSPVLPHPREITARGHPHPILWHPHPALPTSPGNHSPWVPLIPCHPQVPPSLCTPTPVPPSSHSVPNPSVPTSGALIPHPLASFPLRPHILWHRSRPPPRTPQPSVPAPLALSVPRSPLPGPPGPRSRPAHPSPGGGGGARCGNRCAPLPPPGSARPRCSPGAVVRLQHPRAPAAAKNPALAPKKPLPGGDAAGSGPPGMPVGDPAAPVLTFS